MIKRLLSAFSLLALSFGSAFSQSMIITGGNDHGIALCSKGLIFAWGYNNGNRLCLAEPNDKLEIAASPCLVNTGNLTFSQLSAGSGGHSVALSCFKTVYCWGANDHSQCGRASTGAKDFVSGEPIPVPCGEAPGYTLEGEPGGKYLGNVKYISATTAASMAILNDGKGRVVMWGGNLEDGGGGVIETETPEPVFIRDAKGNPLENVIHITGGDNNIMLIVGDSPDAKVGTVYSIGNWNGRGGNGAAKSFTAAPVEIGDGKGLKSSGKYLTNVRNCGISDVGAFAVDGTTGYVYGWGNGGWGCSNGLPNNQTTVYAEKVSAGQYEEMTGETYLTNVTQVIGGNGNGTAVTEDGYVLYWGCNDAANGTTNSGGVIPNSEYAKVASTCKTGPVFANYCAGEKGAKEVRVDDAVAIARGDLYGFMVNKDGDFYTWGTTARPTKEEPKHVGTLGIGKVEYVSTCFKKIEIKCEAQDLCPEAFMVGPRYKCPGEVDSLYCGFTPINKREDNYFFQWSQDGVIINTSKPESSLADRRADEYNKPTIGVLDPGVYRVDIFYIGNNVPCDNCPEANAEIEVLDMKMPVDTFVLTSCVADTLHPAVTDVINYKFGVNTDFYKKGKETSWAVYSSKEGGDPLFKDPVVVNAGSNETFDVTGDKILTVNKNVGVDTTYSVWIEDVTKEEMHLFAKEKSTASGSFQKYGLLLECWNDAELASFDLYLKSYSGTATATVTPVIYKAALNENGQYAVGAVYSRGKKQTIEFGPDFEFVTVDCEGLKLEGNSARGARYVLGMDFDGNCNMGLFSTLNQENSPLFVKPVSDDLSGTAVLAIGSTANNYGIQANGSKECPYFNITFSKLTEYNCGRIELTSRFWCPPCNMPTGKISIESSVLADKDTVFICKETEKTILSVAKVEKAGATFDIQWFDNRTMKDGTELKLDAESSESSFDANWADIPEGGSKMYYLKIRDAEKPDASGCFVKDSIVVKAVKVPEVPTIKIDPYCEGDDSNIAATVTQFFTMPEGLTVSSLTRGTSDFTEATLGADLSALTAGDYTYSMVVKDAHECVSDPADIDVKVNEIPGTPVIEQNPVSYLKETGKLQSLLGAVVGTTGTTVLWATSADLSDTTAIVPSVSLDKQDTIVYQVLLRSEFGCVGEPTDFTVIINDAPAPKVKNDSVCIGSTPDFSLLVTPLNDNYQLKWYTSEEDALAKQNGTPNPSYDLTMPGKQDFFVTQTNLLTGAESAPSTFTVTAIGVNKPTVLKPETLYCKGAAAVPSVETMVELSEDGFYKADQLVWKNDAGGLLTAQDLVPSTDGIKTTYTYYVNQTYTISPTKICEGLPEKITVNISVVPTLTVLPVSYVLSDGKDNGGRYPTLIQKNPNVATPSVANGKLQWYDLDGVTALPSCPAPPYIADQVNDIDYEYYVSQIDENGCESDKTPVSVTVSTSPAPTPVNVELCEDDDLVRATPLQATPGKAGVTDNSEYELVWYGLKDPNGLSVEQKKALNPTIGVGPAPVEAVYNDAIAVNQKCVYTYYVAQRKVTSDNSGAEGKAQPLLVTVYQKPQLKLADPTPVCEPNVVNLANDEIWAFCPEFSDKDRYVKAWYYGNPSVAVTDPTSIAKSGPFDAQVYFLVNGKACLSDKATVNVTVDYIRGLEIVGSETTCPGTTVDLKAETTDISNPSTAVYTWNCESNDDKNKVVPQDPNFTTTTLTAGLGARTYVYTVSVSAGACKNIMSTPHSISIGDGPVQGAVAFTETDNTDAGIFNVSSAGLAFYSCGNALTIDVSGVDHTLNDFAWTDVTAGTPGTPETGAAILNIAQPQGSKKYHVSYTNNCPTGFDITVVSVPVKVEAPTRPNEICQDEDYVHPITVVCDENSYKVVWSKDNLPIAETDTRFKANGMTLENAQPTDNGVYAYTVTNRGCTYSGSLNEGKALKVKPNIQFTVQDQYIARRDSVLEIPLNITVPADGKLQTIQWKSAGVAFDKGNPLSIKVEDDYKLSVLLDDPEYCPASGEVLVKKDAKLQLSVDLIDMICYKEYADLVIDTTGTGSFLMYNPMPIQVIETIGDDERTIEWGWLEGVDGKLHLQLQPSADAIYKVVYGYRLGEGVDQQLLTSVKRIRVLEPIVIEVPEGLQFCGDGQEEYEVALTSVTPMGTSITWSEDPDVVSGLEGNSISIVPNFEEGRTANWMYKNFTVTGTYSICKAVEEHVLVRIDKPLTGTIIAPEAICEGNSTVIDASNYDAETYLWNSETDANVVGMVDSKISVTPVATSTYNVEMTRGECSAEDEYELIVAERPVISKVDSVDYNVRDVIVDGGTSPYYYWIDKITTDSVTTSIFNEVSYGKHTAYVVDAAGCDAKLPFVVVAPEMVIQKLVSPNGDGVNDVFSNVVIREAFPNAKISIFDRWGKKLAEYKGSDNGWDGTYNGQPMPSTDYWYEIEIKELKKTYTGHFTLMRQ